MLLNKQIGANTHWKETLGHCSCLTRTPFPMRRVWGQQHCELKEIQGQMIKKSLVYTAGSITVVHVRKKKSQASRQTVLLLLRHGVLQYTLHTYLSTLNKNRGWPLVSRSFCTVLLPLLFYHIRYHEKDIQDVWQR